MFLILRIQAFISPFISTKLHVWRFLQRLGRYIKGTDISGLLYVVLKQWILLKCLYWVLEIFYQRYDLLCLFGLKVDLIRYNPGVLLEITRVFCACQALKHVLVRMRRFSWSIHRGMILFDVQIFQRKHIGLIRSDVWIVSWDVAWKWMVIKGGLGSESVLRSLESTVSTIENTHTRINSKTFLPGSFSCSHALSLSWLFLP